MTTLYVNASWTAESCGGHTWGVDAFSTIAAANAVAQVGDTIELTGAYTIDNSSTDSVKDGVTFKSNNYLTITGTSKFSANSYPGNLTVGSTEAATTLTTDGLTFDNSEKDRILYITDDSTVTLSGSGFNFSEQSDHGVNIRNSATERSAEIHLGHTLNFSNVTLTADQTFHSIYTNSGSVVNFSGSTIATSANGTYLNTYGGTVNVKDASNVSTGHTNTTGTVNVSGAGTKYNTSSVNLFEAPDGYHAGILNVTDGAEMNVEDAIAVNAAAKDAENYATGGSADASLNLSNATLKSGSIDNTKGGSVTVTGTSKLSVTTYTGNLTLGKSGETTTLTTDGFTQTSKSGKTNIFGNVTATGYNFDTVRIGFGTGSTASDSLTMNGGSAGLTYIGQDKVHDRTYTLNVTGTAAFSGLYHRGSGIVNIGTAETGATVTSEYTNVYGAMNITNSTFTQEGGATFCIVGRTDKEADGSAVVTLDNSTLINHEIAAAGTVYVGTNDDDNGSGELILKNNSSLQVYSLKLNEKVAGVTNDIKVTVDNSKIAVDDYEYMGSKVGTITMGSGSELEIIVGANSAITTGTLTNDGTITVDMSAGTKVAYKLVDASSTSDYGMYDFAIGKGNGYSLSVSNNDLYAINTDNADYTSLAINAAWASTMGYGDEIIIGEGETAKSYYYGITAFSSATDLQSAITTDTTTIVAFGGETALGDLTVSQNLTIETVETTEYAATFTSITVAKDIALTIAAGSNLNGGTITNSGSVNLSGTTKFSGTLAGGTYNFADGTVLTTDGLSGSSNMKWKIVDGSDVLMSGSGFNFAKMDVVIDGESKLTVKDFPAPDPDTTVTGKAWYVTGGSELVFDNSFTGKMSNANVGADSKLTVTNGSTLWMNNTLYSYGETNVGSGTTLKGAYMNIYTDHIDGNASGKIIVDGGTLDTGRMRIGYELTSSSYAGKGDNKAAALELKNGATMTLTNTNSQRAIKVGTDEIEGKLVLNDTSTLTNTCGTDIRADNSSKGWTSTGRYILEVGKLGEVTLNGSSVIDWKEAINNAGTITLNGTSQLLHESNHANATVIVNSGTITLSDSAKISSSKDIENEGGTVIFKGEGTAETSTATVDGLIFNGTIVYDNFVTSIDFSYDCEAISLKNGSKITSPGGQSSLNISVDNASQLIMGDSFTVEEDNTLALGYSADHAMITVTGAIDTSEAKSFTIDMKDATANVYKIIDAQSTANYGEENITILNNGTGEDAYTVKVVDNDLIVMKADAMKTLLVDADWTSTSELPEGYVWGVNAFNTIQDAVNAADVSTGAVTVSVAAGTYDGDVALYGKSNLVYDGGTKVGRIHFIADGTGETIVNGKFTFGNDSIQSQDICDVQVTGFTFNNVDYPIYIMNSGTASKDIVFTNNTITLDESTGSSSYGPVYVNSKDVDGVTVTGNSITGATMYAMSFSGSTGTVNNVTVSGNTITDSSAIGIFGQIKADGVTVSNNTFSNVDYAIWTRNGTSNANEGTLTLSSNTITGCEVVVGFRGKYEKSDIVIGEGNTVDSEAVTEWADPDAEKYLVNTNAYNNNGVYNSGKLYVGGETAFTTAKAAYDAASDDGTLVMMNNDQPVEVAKSSIDMSTLGVNSAWTEPEEGQVFTAGEDVYYGGLNAYSSVADAAMAVTAKGTVKLYSDMEEKSVSIPGETFLNTNANNLSATDLTTASKLTAEISGLEENTSYMVCYYDATGEFYAFDSVTTEPGQTSITVERTDGAVEARVKYPDWGTVPGATVVNTITSGTLQLDEESTVSFSGTLKNNGTIEADMTGATAPNYKLMDSTGTKFQTYGSKGSSYKFAEGKDEGYTLQTVDSDLYAYKSTASKAIVLISSDWAGKEFGVPVGADFTYGVNAFSNFSDANSAIDSTTSMIVIKGLTYGTDGNSGTQILANTGSSDLTISTEGAVVMSKPESYTGLRLQLANAAYGYVFAQGSDLTIFQFSTGLEVKFTINGNLTVDSSILVEGNDMTIGKTGTLTLDGTVNASGAGTNFHNWGILNVEGALNVNLNDYGTQRFKIGDDGYDNAGIELNVNGGTVTIRGTDEEQSDVAVTVIGGIGKEGDTAAKLSVTNGGLFDTTGKIVNNGTITIDAKESLIKAASFTAGDNSTITVDMTDAENILYKVVENTGSDTMKLANYGTVTFTGSDDYTAMVIDNDLYAVDKDAADKSTLIVNKIYEGMSLGQEITIGEKTYYYGINAFSTAEDVSASVADTTTKIVAYGGATALGTLEVSQDLTIETAGTETYGATFTGITVAKDTTLTVAAGSKLAADNFTNSGTITIDGDTTGSTGTLLEKVTWENGSTLSLVDNSSITIDCDFANNITVESGSYLQVNKNVTLDAGESITLGYADDNTLNVGGTLDATAGSITVDMTGATEDEYTIIYASGTSTYGTNLTVTGGAYTLSVEDNCLYARKAVASMTFDGQTTYYGTFAEALAAAQAIDVSKRAEKDSVTVTILKDSVVEGANFNGNNTGITITGEEGSTITGDFGADGDCYLKNTTFKGLNFAGGKITFSTNVLDYTGFTIDGCTMDGTGAGTTNPSAITINRNATVSADGIQVINNTIKNYTATNASGIVIGNSNTIAKDVVVSGNTIENVYFNAMQVFACEDAVISGNTVKLSETSGTSCGSNALNLLNTSATVSDNTVTLTNAKKSFIANANRMIKISAGNSLSASDLKTPLTDPKTIVQYSTWGTKDPYYNDEVIFVTDNTEFDDDGKIIGGDVFASEAQLETVLKNAEQFKFLSGLDSNTLVYVTDVANNVCEISGPVQGTVKVPDGYTFTLTQDTTFTEGTKLYVPYTDGSTELTSWKAANIPAEQSANVTVGGWVAAIGDTKYYSLNEALTDATSGQTVDLLADVAETSFTLKDGITLDAHDYTITTTEGWTLNEGSVLKANSLINGTDVTAMTKTGTVNGTIYASSGTLDLRGVDLRVKGEPAIYGGTAENPETLDTLKATRVFFGDTHDGGGNQTITNIVLENETNAYRAALGVYFDTLTVDTVSVNAEEGWYWDQQYQNYNYQMYTGFGGTLNINKSLTTGEYMNAGYSIGGTGITNLAAGATINCLDFQNTGNSQSGVTPEQAAKNIADGIVNVNGAEATLNAAALNNHAITTFGTVNLTSHPVHTTATGGLYNVNYGTGAVLTIGQLNFLNKEGDTTKSQMRAGDNAVTTIGGLSTNPAVGVDFYVTQTSETTVNKDGGNAVQFTGDVVFTAYADAASEAKFTLNLDSSDDYFTGAIRGTTSDSNRWGKWGSAVMGDEVAATDNIKSMTLTVTNGAVWNMTGDSAVNTLTVTDSTLNGSDAALKIQLSGTFKLNYASDITVNAIVNNGTILVDMTGATGAVYKLVDAGTTSDYGTYQFAEGKQNGYTIMVVNNDLYAVRDNDIIVNSNYAAVYTAGDPIDGKDGYFYGINAFAEIPADVSKVEKIEITGGVTNLGSTSITFAEDATLVVDDGATLNALNGGALVNIDSIAGQGSIILDKTATTEDVTALNNKLALGATVEIVRASVATDDVKDTTEIIEGKKYYNVITSEQSASPETVGTGDEKVITANISLNNTDDVDGIILKTDDEKDLVVAGAVNNSETDKDLKLEKVSTSNLVVDGDVSGFNNVEITNTGAGIDQSAIKAEVKSTIAAEGNLTITNAASTETTKQFVTELGVQTHTAKGDVTIKNGSESKIIGTEVDGVEVAANVTADKDVTIYNDGHLNANVTAGEKLKITNTSSNTLTGSAKGESVSVANTETGAVVDETIQAFGTGAGVAGSVTLFGEANSKFTGSNKIVAGYNTDRTNFELAFNDGTGTVNLNGTNTFSGELEVKAATITTSDASATVNLKDVNAKFGADLNDKLAVNISGKTSISKIDGTQVTLNGYGDNITTLADGTTLTTGTNVDAVLKAIEFATVTLEGGAKVNSQNQVNLRTSTLTLTGAGTKLTTNTNAGALIDGKSTLTIEDGAALEADKDIDNSGTVNVTNATLKTNTKITNSGTMTGSKAMLTGAVVNSGTLTGDYTGETVKVTNTSTGKAENVTLQAYRESAGFGAASLTLVGEKGSVFTGDTVIVSGYNTTPEDVSANDGAGNIKLDGENTFTGTLTIKSGAIGTTDDALAVLNLTDVKAKMGMAGPGCTTSVNISGESSLCRIDGATLHISADYDTYLALITLKDGVTLGAGTDFESDEDWGVMVIEGDATLKDGAKVWSRYNSNALSIVADKTLTLTGEGTSLTVEGGLTNNGTIDLEEGAKLILSKGLTNNATINLKGGAVNDSATITGGTVNWVLDNSEYTASSVAWSVVSGATTKKTITVDADATVGTTYTLATSASGADGATFTLTDGVSTSATITVNGDDVTYGGLSYSLDVIAGELVLTAVDLSVLSSSDTLSRRIRGPLSVTDTSFNMTRRGSIAVNSLASEKTDEAAVALKYLNTTEQIGEITLNGDIVVTDRAANASALPEGRNTYGIQITGKKTTLTTDYASRTTVTRDTKSTDDANVYGIQSDGAVNAEGTFKNIITVTATNTAKKNGGALSATGIEADTASFGDYNATLRVSALDKAAKTNTTTDATGIKTTGTASFEKISKSIYAYASGDGATAKGVDAGTIAVANDLAGAVTVRAVSSGTAKALAEGFASTGSIKVGDVTKSVTATAQNTDKMAGDATANAFDAATNLTLGDVTAAVKATATSAGGAAEAVDFSSFSQNVTLGKVSAALTAKATGKGAADATAISAAGSVTADGFAKTITATAASTDAVATATGVKAGGTLTAKDGTLGTVTATATGIADSKAIGIETGALATDGGAVLTGKITATDAGKTGEATGVLLNGAQGALTATLDVTATGKDAYGIQFKDEADLTLLDSELEAKTTAAEGGQAIALDGNEAAQKIALTGSTDEEGTSLIGAVDLGAGADVLALSEASAITGNVDLGADANTLTMTDSSKITGDVTTGAAADQIALDGAASIAGDAEKGLMIEVSTGAGNDAIELKGTSTIGAIEYDETGSKAYTRTTFDTVDMGDGYDTLDIYAGARVTADVKGVEKATFHLTDMNPRTYLWVGNEFESVATKIDIDFSNTDFDEGAERYFTVLRDNNGGFDETQAIAMSGTYDDGLGGTKTLDFGDVAIGGSKTSADGNWKVSLELVDNNDETKSQTLFAVVTSLA